MKEIELLLNGKKTPSTKSDIDSQISLLNEKEQETEAQPEKNATVLERIMVSLIEYSTFIRQNKRNLATVVVLWFSFVISCIAFSQLGPFFPEEVLLNYAAGIVGTGQTLSLLFYRLEKGVSPLPWLVS